MKIVEGVHNPHYPVIGKEIPCEWCGAVFVPESRSDIDQVTHEDDYIMTCPKCEKLVWAYWGTDKEIHSGKWYA